MKDVKKRIFIPLTLILILLLWVSPVFRAEAAWRHKSTGWYYYTKSGRLQKSRWVGDRYVNSKGRWIVSFKKTGKGFRYKNGSEGYLKSQWKTIDGNRYYFNKKGYAVTQSWVGKNYLEASGKYVKGLVKTSKGWRFRDEKNRYITNKWKTINNKRCYFDKNGYVVKNKRITINGVKYSFDKYGFMKPGIRTTSKGKKYQNQSGSYLKNSWKKVSGKWYYFGSNGYMVKKKWVGDYYLGSNGAMVKSTFVGSKFVDASGKKVSSSALSLSAPSAVLIDAETGKVIYQKNASQNRPNASTTKIMTAILALEYAGLNDSVSVSAYAASQEEVKLYMNPGEVYRMQDLLYAMLLPSYNDVAVAIAEHISGSVQNFADLMNQKARQLGCKNTTFVTPNGLELGNHGSSALDLAKMLRYAMKDDLFRQIIQTGTYSFSCLSNGRGFTVYSTDDMLGQMSGFLGGKTGWTTLAGHCFAGAMRKNGKTYISVVLGCASSESRWRDTRTLLNYGAANY